MSNRRKKGLVFSLTMGAYFGMYWLFLDYFGNGEGISWIYSSMQYKSQFIAFAAFSVLLNMYIIYFHASNPPHPKYIMLPKRKFSMMSHIIGGSAEVIAGAMAWFCIYTGDVIIFSGYTWSIITVVCVFTAHAPSALFQTPGVFGAKGVMIPAYIGISSLHIYCAIHLAFEPESLLWIERTWITLQAYAFVRLYGRLMWKFGMIPNSTYTVGTMAGGATIIHFVIGPAGFLLFSIGIIFYIQMTKIILKPSTNEYKALMEERTHSATINDSVRTMWLELNTESASSGLSEIEAAKAAFQSLDRNNSGALDVDEIKELLISWDATPHVIQAYIDRFEHQEEIDFDCFRKTVWSIGNMQKRISVDLLRDKSLSDPDLIAKSVFEFLDIDQSGFLELMELEVLLVEWGMAPYEAVDYMEHFGGDDGKISIGEFTQDMAPLWKFAYKRAQRIDDAP
jgi:Ca2+-binding EF-hand superfamily protein